MLLESLTSVVSPQPALTTREQMCLGKDKRFGLTTTKVAPDEKDKISIRAVTTANVHRTGLSDTIEMSPFARGVVVGTDGAVARAVATGPALSCPAGKEEPGVVVVSPM